MTETPPKRKRRECQPSHVRAQGSQCKRSGSCPRCCNCYRKKPRTSSRIKASPPTDCAYSNYVCSECQRGFDRAEDLTRHSDGHTRHPLPPSPAILRPRGRAIDYHDIDSDSDEGPSVEAPQDLMRRTLNIAPGDLPGKLANGCPRTKKKAIEAATRILTLVGDTLHGEGKGSELVDLVVGL